MVWWKFLQVLLEISFSFHAISRILIRVSKYFSRVWKRKRQKKTNRSVVALTRWPFAHLANYFVSFVTGDCVCVWVLKVIRGHRLLCKLKANIITIIIIQHLNSVMGMGVASLPPLGIKRRQLPPLGICQIKNDQADQLCSLQKTKRRQTGIW